MSVRVADLSDVAACGRIDGFVRDHRDATPFPLTGWSRGVERGCRQRAHFLLAEGVGGAIAGVLPLTEMRSRLFGNALVSAGFAVDGGAVALESLTQFPMRVGDHGQDALAQERAVRNGVADVRETFGKAILKGFQLVGTSKIQRAVGGKNSGEQVTEVGYDLLRKSNICRSCKVNAAAESVLLP